MCDAQCQTDPVRIFEDSPDIKIHVSKIANAVGTQLDHCYENLSDHQPHSLMESCPSTSTPVKNKPVSQELTLNISPLKDMNTSDASSRTLDQAQDRTWVLSESDVESDSDSDKDDVRMKSDKDSVVYQEKLMVFSDKLEQLLMKIVCTCCSSPVNTLTRNMAGTGATYTLEFIRDHPSFVWSTQPIVCTGKKQVYAGNVMMASAILFSGLTYTVVKKFSKLLHLPCIGETLYYELQCNILLPVVNEKWEADKKNLHRDVISNGKSLTLAGDGRCDSPGFSAKYCTYTMMDSPSNCIIDFEQVQVTQTGTSQSMEKLGFKTVLDRLIAKKLPISIIVAD